MARKIRDNYKKTRVLHAIDETPVVYPPPQRSPIEPKTDNQRRYINAIKSFDLIVGTGPAGCGKTYLAAGLAAEALLTKKTEKIIVTRPAIDAGESLGFLPGELDEKYEPYLQPVRQVFLERMGKGHMEYALKSGDIEPSPLAYMRGMTFKNCWVILDEAQNVTPSQMKMFLTRIGQNCKVIVCGDPDQVDLPGPSGLSDAVDRISWIPNVKVIRFGEDDVVRSGIVRDILSSYATSQPLITRK
jgi:phosphate starvation-inducible protein PhoH and related proteins